MPPAAGSDDSRNSVSTMHVRPLTHKHGADATRGTRVLIQIYESSASLSNASTIVLSTFVDGSLTLAQLRLTLPDIATAHSEFKLSERDWSFVYGIKSPVGGSPIYYTVPKKQEEDELVADFAPALLVKLAAKPKSQEQVEENTSQGFELEELLETDCCGSPAMRQTIILHPTTNPRSNDLCTKLRQVMRHDSALHDTIPKIAVSKLFAVFTSLKQHAASCKPLQTLVDKIEHLQHEEIEKMARLKTEGSVTFEYLQHLLAPGTKIVTERKGIDGMLIGGKVESTRYVQNWCGTFFEVTYQVIKSNGKRFFLSKERAVVPSFAGTQEISKLPIRILTPDTEAALTERGRRFNAYGLGSHYLNYRGNMIKETWCGFNFTKAQGRIMLDAISFERINPNSRYHHDTADTEAELCLDEAVLYMCWPTLLGFSFAAKKWGEVDLELVDEIKFDDSAFTSLVLADDKKALIQSLVNNYQTSFSDIIAGKGGGCIFLLHGQPGTGKTLTAEAIAELLHRPLYSVSVGELGTNTTELENSLREILEVASAWNAVVLLDEADIFLEKRTDSDVKRNAMVGVFLRLLEYHQGVLFLTTNRVKSFDSAFHSRISVALRYPDLDRAQRKQVWTNLLAAACIENLDVEQLSAYELNGRQIKTTIRLAQALALNQGCEVKATHVERTVAVARQFSDDLAGTNTW